jgi:phosphonate transport system substrate-binding protein
MRFPLALAFLLAAGLPPASAMAAAQADPQQLIFIFQKQTDPEKIQSTADTVGRELSARLGMPVRVQVPGDYSASVQALVSKKADFAYVSAMPFLLARRDGGATLLLAEQRIDAAGRPRTDYDSILVVRHDSPLRTVDDLKANAAQTRMVFTSATSTSGYIMAYYRFVREGMLKAGEDPRRIFRSTAFGGGYTQALEQVIANRGDVAAVSDYTMEGPRADVYLKPEQRSQLRILARTPGVPTHLICARDGLSDGLKARVKSALLELAREKPELLADVYGASAFVEVDEQKHVQHAIDAIEFIGLPIEGLAK